MIVAFDLEGTLVNAELIPALGEALGKRTILDDITEKGMNGEIDFRTSLSMRLELLKGLEIAKAQEIAAKLPLSRGAKEAVNGVKRLGGTPIIVTGGFDILADRVAQELGIEYVGCNRFKVVDGCIDGVNEPIVTGIGKAQKVLGLAEWLGVDPMNCVAIGDGANDILMMRSVGYSIAYNGREKVRAAAKIAITGDDLTQVLPLIEKFTEMIPPEEGLLVTAIQ